MIEESAGCVLLQASSHSLLALVIRVRQQGFEIPKGHIEAGETREQAAIRELQEETGLVTSVQVHKSIGFLAYRFEKNNDTIEKIVHYFAATTATPLEFAAKPRNTRELRWITATELETLPLVNEDLRSILQTAFQGL